MNETMLAKMHHIVLQEGIRIHNSTRSSKKVFNEQLMRSMHVLFTTVYSSFDSIAYRIFKFQGCIRCKLYMKYSNMLLYRLSLAIHVASWKLRAALLLE